MPLADTLLRLAAVPNLYRPKWSDRIMQEVSRNLQQSFGLSPKKAKHRESEIQRHFPEAWVDGFDDLLPTMTNHPKDRHVLAAAVKAGAQWIVTYNAKDFPASSLSPYGIAVVGPSMFLKTLHDRASSPVLETLESQASAIGQTREYLFSRLKVNAPGFIAHIEKTIQAADKG
jgi:hypothetical protein